MSFAYFRAKYFSGLRNSRCTEFRGVVSRPVRKRKKAQSFLMTAMNSLIVAGMARVAAARKALSLFLFATESPAPVIATGKNMNVKKALETIRLEMTLQAGNHRRAASERTRNFQYNGNLNRLVEVLRLEVIADSLDKFAKNLSGEEFQNMTLEKTLEIIRLALDIQSGAYKKRSDKQTENYREDRSLTHLVDAARFQVITESLEGLVKVMTVEKIEEWKEKHKQSKC